jgi:uncharacterized protein (DUF885 family)
MTRHRSLLLLFILLPAWFGGLTPGASQDADPPKKPVAQPPDKKKIPPVPNLVEIVSRPRSEMRDIRRRYEADQGNLNRWYNIPASPTRHARMNRFYAEWLAALKKLDPDKFSQERQTDYQKLKGDIERDLRELELQARRQVEIAPLLPFAPTIIKLEEARRRMEGVDAARAAGVLNAMKKQIEQIRKVVETALKSEGEVEKIKVNKVLANRAAQTTASLRTTLKNWFSFYNGYDPLFTWWMGEPYKEVDQALLGYGTFLREKAGGKAGEEESPEPMPLQAVKLPAKPRDVPDLRELMDSPRSELTDVIQRYQTDHKTLSPVSKLPKPPQIPPSPERLAQRTKFYTDWLAALRKLNFDKLSQEGKIDYLLLKNHLQRELRRVELQAKTQEEIARLVAFESSLVELEQARSQKQKIDPDKAAAILSDVQKKVVKLQEALLVGRLKASSASAGSALEKVNTLSATLDGLFTYFVNADPKLAESAGKSCKDVKEALREYAKILREKSSVKTGDPSGIVGRPIGRQALLNELAAEMIPYTPEELIALANKELVWCEVEMKKASQKMGFGDDWQKAVEKVKTLHVAPGKQPELIRDLAREAIAYLKKHDLVTVPPLASETWRMEMMSPQRQLVNPFFTGGEVISVSFPTNTMSYEAKLQSMRGNNVHFARATVHHELIPGHHLQGFMTARYHTHRRPFATPFWLEGWALYWEMVLYDRGFATTPEDRVGFLFWRMHRCARIIFSLNFHLEKMTPQECIDLLVKRVGHEPANATAEVRRSFVGNYGPLYQAAYMLGGLQIRALRKELVDSGKMSERAFHDAILKGNNMPIAMVRARLANQKLKPDFPSPWRFYD